MNPTADKLSRRTIVGCLAALVIVGSYFRLANLGELGFRWDEDLSSLAVQAILEKGVPELPSGMVYVRGGAFLYMMAASAELLGFSELSLRLPAALFGIASIPLAFLFVRALFGAPAGLITAALVTISIWDIEFSRYARMYAPFGFFYLLTIHCLWKYRVQSESLRGAILCVLAAMTAISLHQLGYTLVLAFGFPLLIAGPREWLQPRRWAFPVVGGGAVAAFFFFWREVQGRLRELPVLAAGEGAAAPALGPTAAEPSGFGDFLSEVPLLAGLIDRTPPLAVALVGGLLVVGAFVASRRALRPLDRVLLLSIAACCALQLFNLALLGVLGLAFSKGAGLRGFGRRDVLAASALVGAAFLLWFSVAMTLGLVTEEAAGVRGVVKSTIHALIDYPHFFVFWGYPDEWPLVSLVAAVGFAWTFDRAARGKVGAPPLDRSAVPATRETTAARFLILTLLTPLIVNGLFDTDYQLFRYNVPLNPFYFAFVALALVHWRDVLGAVAPSRPGMRDMTGAPAAAATVLLVLLVIGFDLNPLRGWLVTQRQYQNDGVLYRVFDMERYVDFKTPAAFVDRSATGEDWIVALDSREYFNYIGRLDFWVRTGVYATEAYRRDGKLRDQYVDTPLVMSVEELESLLRKPGRRKWLIANDAAMAQTRALTDDIKEFIREQDEHVVYVGRDGLTKVYLFDCRGDYSCDPI